MKNFIKKTLLGITLPQEYLCIPYESLISPLNVYIKNEKEKNLENISGSNILIGYKPLLLGCFNVKYLDKIKPGYIKLFFGRNENEIIAELVLTLVELKQLGTQSFYIFKGVKGKHKFINPFHRFANNFHYRISAEKKINLYLGGNLYQQVKIAYSVPRKIYLASVGYGGLFNIFPTDLSGVIAENNFVMSLRNNGKANKQIENSGKCLAAEMHTDSFMEVYMSGRNHIKDISPADSLGIKLNKVRSEKLNLPVPENATCYYELERIDHTGIEVHNLHFFNILNKVIVRENSPALAHIYREYVEWRLKNNLETKLFLR